MTAPRIVIAQMGARMHYLVPRILHERGVLERFYTDICAVKGWPRLVRRVVPRSWRAGGLKALLERVPEGVPSYRITAFTGFGRRYAGQRRRAQTETQITRANLWAGRTFCDLVVRQGLGDATAVYTFNSAALELLQHTRRRGLLCMMEQTIAPKAVEARLLAEEEERFPGWAAEEVRDSLAGQFAEREQAEWEAADAIFCGSQFVRDGIEQVGGPVQKTIVVPYGVRASPRYADRKRSGDGPLGVLFAGTVGLRKGIGDLARAAARVGQAAVRVRAAGSVALSDLGRTEVARSVQLLGRVPRSAMEAEYGRADVFVLPSVCEGSATVCYEALAAGLPVIATPNTGSVVRDGIDGFIVPVRCPEAIAEKLEILVEDRDRLREMSRNAWERAREFTLERYGQRLLDAIFRLTGSDGTGRQNG